MVSKTIYIYIYIYIWYKDPLKYDPLKEYYLVTIILGVVLKNYCTYLSLLHFFLAVFVIIGGIKFL